ncbi:DUF4145 domain-containing protein [Sphingomonas sp.]|uniref:DUF4145 domain-containing protein n=1 Tax=Sphingomonas sp. TaxID=28214 RepID=UPI00286A7E47|nr:DUF4145 domain-containing protein [Sphingomonas sp.]
MEDPALFNGIVYGLSRCPQCGVAKPLISAVVKPAKHFADSFYTYWQFTAECSKCRRHTLFYGHTDGSDPEAENVKISETYPELPTVAEDLPERAKRFLQQAFESKHAPDGVVMLAASAIDAMLKDKGYKEGALYSRIEKAAVDGTLTEQMRDWAHEIRLNANEPRHADDDFDGYSSAEATQVIEFANALGEYLFVLPARVLKWKSKTTADEL